MLYGIEGGPIPLRLPYAQPIQSGCQVFNFSPCLAYAIAWRETIRGEKAGLWPSAVNVVSGDGGHGLFQLTSSWPSDWESINANIAYALSHFLVPTMHFFAGAGQRGEALIRCIAAAFNEGTQTAYLDHLLGNVDIGTTGHDYASDVLAQYQRLIANEDPV
jgi:hypothetical protein